MDIVPEGAGAFAVNKPVTDGHVQQMIDKGVFCQGIINQITWAKPDPPPNALHTAFTHSKAVEGISPSREPRVLGDEPCLHRAL